MTESTAVTAPEPGCEACNEAGTACELHLFFHRFEAEHANVLAGGRVREASDAAERLRRFTGDQTVCADGTTVILDGQTAGTVSHLLAALRHAERSGMRVIDLWFEAGRP